MSKHEGRGKRPKRAIVPHSPAANVPIKHGLPQPPRPPAAAASMVPGPNPEQRVTKQKIDFKKRRRIAVELAAIVACCVALATFGSSRMNAAQQARQLAMLKVSRAMVLLGATPVEECISEYTTDESKIGQAADLAREVELSCPALSSQVALLRSHIHVAQGQFQAALQDTTEAIALDDSYSRAHTHRAFVLQLLGQYESALAECTKALALTPEDILARNQEAVILNKIGRYEDAVAECKRVILLNPAFVPVHVVLSNALLGLRRTDEALAELTAASVLDPGSAAPYVNSANILFDLGRYEEAAIAGELAVERDRENPKAAYNLGIVYKVLGRYDEALATLDRALALNPQNGDAHIARGNVQVKLGNRNEAAREYRRAATLEESSALAWRCLGSALHDLGREAEALPAIDRAVGLEPDNVMGWVWQGEILLVLDRVPEALVAFDRVLRLDPSMGVTFVSKSACLLRLGRFDDARRAAESGLLDLKLSDGDRSLAHYLRGRSLKGLGLFHEALNEYDLAMVSDNSNTDAVIGKASILVREGCNAEALALLDSLGETGKRNPRVWQGKAQALAELGQLDAAKAAAEQAVMLDPRSPGARTDLATITGLLEAKVPRGMTGAH